MTRLEIALSKRECDRTEDERILIEDNKKIEKTDERVLIEDTVGSKPIEEDNDSDSVSLIEG
jgi:hypothetical protein